MMVGIGTNAANTPRDAATVIITRDSRARQYEVFLMRRHQDQDFLGGAYVFPGGRLDEEDCDPGLLPYTRGLSREEASRLLQEADLPGARAVGLFLTAIRETIEEAGVLLACEIEGTEAAVAERLTRYRQALHKREMTMKQLAQEENLLFDLGTLVPYAHWITPEIVPTRFDTRFFLAPIPAGQTPIHDDKELVESLWVAPSVAIEQSARNELLLMPPTIKIMEDLSAFETAADLFRAAKTKRIETVLPQAFSGEEGQGIKLPHDSEYTIAQYKQPPRRGETSRIYMNNGTWKCAVV